METDSLSAEPLSGQQVLITQIGEQMNTLRDATFVQHLLKPAALISF